MIILIYKEINEGVKVMRKLDKERCSVYCFCIKDTVKLLECEICFDYSTKERYCLYGEGKSRH